MMLPLITIGVSLVTAQAVVAAISLITGPGVSNQTIVFLSAMIAGAGTDYAVFLISRYHDYVRLGEDSDQAVRQALRLDRQGDRRVRGHGRSITFLGNGLRQLGVFSTVGVALAVAIGVAFLAAVTLLPAILVLAGPRGWVAPAPRLTSAFWRRSGIRIVRRPKASIWWPAWWCWSRWPSCASLVHFNYDDRKALPDTADSSVGYAAMDRHLPGESDHSPIPLRSIAA